MVLISDNQVSLHSLDEGFPVLSQDELSFESQFVTNLNKNLIIVAGETNLALFSLSADLTKLEHLKNIDNVTDSFITAIGHKNGNTLALTGSNGDVTLIKLTLN